MRIPLNLQNFSTILLLFFFKKKQKAYPSLTPNLTKIHCYKVCKYILCLEERWSKKQYFDHVRMFWIHSLRGRSQDNFAS